MAENYGASKTAKLIELRVFQAQQELTTERWTLIVILGPIGCASHEKSWSSTLTRESTGICFKHIVCIICEGHLLDNYDVCCFDLIYDQFWVCWVLFLYDDCNLGRAKKVKGWNVHEFCPLHQRKYKTAFYSFYLPVALAMLVTGVRDRAAYDTAREALLLETQSSYSTCPCVYHPYSVICVVCTSPEEKTDQHLPRGAK